MEIIVFSKAMYSTWLYYAPDRILFDCGEGISTNLSNKLFAVKKIFLTHSHADHISGLWGLLNTRNSAMGEKDKPLEIFYPKNSKNIKRYLEFIFENCNYFQYEIKTQEIDENFIIELENGKSKRYLTAFKTQHLSNELTLGYSILENRRKLKNEYRNLEKLEIKKLVYELGKEELTEEYTQKLFTFSGDTYALPYEILENTDTLFHECTFLKSEDRHGESHTTLSELEKVLLEAKPKKVYLYHISSRYNGSIKDIISNYEEAFKEKNIDFKYIYPGKICYI